MVRTYLAPWLELFVVLAWETGHRSKSIAALRWSDLDLGGHVTLDDGATVAAPQVHWRAENDKMGHAHATPLSSGAVEALRAELACRPAIGDTWLFPSTHDVSQHVTHDVLGVIWRRIAKRAGIPLGER